jgi:hypothetical protein
MAPKQEEGRMSPLRLAAALLLVFTALRGGPAVAGPFGPGDLVVLQVNSGAGTNPTTTTVPVTLAEYTPTGTLVQSIDLSSLASRAGINLSLTGSIPDLEGHLSRSSDGRFLTLAGYSTASGSSTSASYQGVIARVDSSGTVDFTTTGSSTFSPASSTWIQGATSNDGSRFWVAGGNALGTTTPGSSSAINWFLTDANGFSAIRVTNGQLYFVTGLGPTSVQQTNPALPTGGATTTTLVSFLNPTNDFVLLNRTGGTGPDTLYVATDGVGLAKYFFNGSGWQFAGTTLIFGKSSIFGLSGVVDPNTGNADLFLTTGDGTDGSGTGPGGASQLVEFTDTAAFSANINGAATALATAASGFTFKGLDFAPQVTAAPEPGTLVLGGIAALGMAGVRYLRRRQAVDAGV